ncbi:MAG: hypothetical protein J0652_06060 [Desulfobulbaceae bacterium]|nr:hypothetical protein [Desulfobulbaceae bacterium]
MGSFLANFVDQSYSDPFTLIVGLQDLTPNSRLTPNSLLQWMDEAAFITATRFSRQKMVTVCSDGLFGSH